MPSNSIDFQKNGIALLGASGRSGRAIAETCIARGIPVSALSRSGALDIEHPLLRAVHGDARDPEAVARLVTGRSAIVSALGARKGEGPLFSASAAAVIEAARAAGVKRFLGLTGLSLLLPGDRFLPSVRFSAVILRAMYPGVLRDRDSGFRAIMASGLDWTILRLPAIDPDLPARGYSIDADGPRGKKIGTKDLASAVLDLIGDPGSIGKAPFLASRA